MGRKGSLGKYVSKLVLRTNITYVHGRVFKESLEEPIKVDAVSACNMSHCGGPALNTHGYDSFIVLQQNKLSQVLFRWYAGWDIIDV